MKLRLGRLLFAYFLAKPFDDAGFTSIEKKVREKIAFFKDARSKEVQVFVNNPNSGLYAIDSDTIPSFVLEKDDKKIIVYRQKVECIAEFRYSEVADYNSVVTDFCDFVKMFSGLYPYVRVGFVNESMVEFQTQQLAVSALRRAFCTNVLKQAKDLSIMYVLNTPGPLGDEVEMNSFTQVLFGSQDTKHY